jgi:hypothetical protein
MGARGPAKGCPKPEGAGRKAGTPNKKTQDLFEICAKHNLDVFEAMVIQAAMEEDPTKRFSQLESLAKYLYPRRKEVDMKVDVEPIEVILRDYTSKK